jgi:hypothetical protein
VKPSAGDEYQVDWEVQIDALNSTFVYCEKTKSKAYFYNDGEIHYFTHFDGDKTSLLFQYYLSAYKVMMGYYKNLLVTDNFPVNTFNNHFLGILQDFIAPFYIFAHAGYSIRYVAMEDELMQSGIKLHSITSARVGKHEIKKMECDLFVGPHGLERFTILVNGQKTEVILVHER